MEIYCKTCDKVLGNYPDEKIPPNVKGHTTCKTCGDKIELYRKEEGHSSSSFDEIVRSHPILSSQKDRGVRKEDFMALAIGLIILFNIAYIFKPDFNLSKFFQGKLQAEIMKEMMNNPQGQGNELPENFTDFKKLQEAAEEIARQREV